ncbi:MAG TPA: IPT/TIG domain-containing protein [Puia sp.]
MKKLIIIYTLLALAACKKNNSSAPPVITSVHTVYKSIVDSALVTNITIRDSAGTIRMDTTSYKNTNPQIVKFDSTTTAGNLGNLYAIMGQNFGGTLKVMFNGQSVYFNPALSSDNTILVTIPQNAPSGGNQSNKLEVVTTHGTASFQFVVLAPPPTIVSLSNMNFSAGSQITLLGLGFKSVTDVSLKGSNDKTTIVTQNDSVLTLQFPTTTLTRTNLVFTYGSGTLTSTQEFVNLDKAYQIFTDDFQNAWTDNSWQGPSGRTTATAKSGTASYIFTYPANGWKIEGAANWYPSMDYDPAYKYLSFWIKGGNADHVLTIVGDQMDGGYSQNTSATAFTITVPAQNWTYFKIPLGAPASSDPKLLNFWKNGTPAKQLGFFLKGQGSDPDETMYVDDLIFIK